VAIHLESLEEVFDAERAGRLRSHIREVLFSPPFRKTDDVQAKKYQEKNLQDYQRACEEGRAAGHLPDDAVASLLHERLGSTYRGRETPSPPEAEGAQALAPILAAFGVSWWRYLGHKYRIAEPRRPGRWRLPWRG